MENNAPHIHSFKDIIVPSTCKERGYTLHKCDCGYEHKDNFQPLSGHSFKLVEEIKSDCTNDGSQKVVCSVCGQEVVTTIPSPGHRFGAWNVVEFATCTQDGVQERYCGVCGAKEMQAIPATGHKLTKPVKSQTKKSKYECYCENCGETFTKKSKKKALIAIIILVLFLAAAALAGIKFLLPYYHYSMGKKLIEQGDYAAAYAHLYDCVDYKDSRKLLSDFCFKHYENKRQYYTNDENGKPTVSGTIEDKTISKYDEHGYLTKEICQNEDGSEDIYTYYRDYDKNGNMISCTTYRNSEFSGRVEYYPTGETKYLYDENNELINLYNYKWNDKGDIIEETRCNAYGEVEAVSEYSYKYDSNGNAIKMTVTTTTDEATTTYSLKYEYDESGLMTAWTRFDKNGDISQKVTWKYEFNENGFKLTTTFYDEGKMLLKSTNNYSTPVSYREIEYIIDI